MADQDDVTPADDPEVRRLLEDFSAAVSGNDFETAVKVGDALVSHCERAADIPPDSVAKVKCTLGMAFARTAHMDDAYRLLSEAIDAYRTLAADDPETYEPLLAQTLGKLGSVVMDSPRAAEAESLLEEAVTICRRRAEADPARTSDLAGALNVLGVVQMKQDDPRAEATLTESVALFRPLFQAEPAVWAVDLGGTLDNIARLLLAQGRLDEADAILGEATDVLMSQLGTDQGAVQLLIQTKLLLRDLSISALPADADVIDRAVTELRGLASPSDVELKVLPGYLESVRARLQPGIAEDRMYTIISVDAATFHAGFDLAARKGYDVAETDELGPDMSPSAPIERAFADEPAPAWARHHARVFTNVFHPGDRNLTAAESSNGISDDLGAYETARSFVAGMRCELEGEGRLGEWDAAE